MSLKIIDKKLPELKRSKNYNKKFKIIDDLYDIIEKNVKLMKEANRVDSREMASITKSLESIIKIEYVLDSEIQVINSDNTPVLFDFD